METIILKGVMRSGNVFLRLILNAIFNENNIEGVYPYNYRFFRDNISLNTTEGGKSIKDPGLHDYEDIVNNNILIIPWRDPRDSIISFIRTEYSKLPLDPMFPWKNKFPTLEYILENCERTAKEQINMFKIMMSIVNKHPKNHTLELKYETYHNDFDFLFNKLEEFFKIRISLETREYLKKEYSKKTIINFQKSMSNFNTFHDTSHVHGEHVWKGDNKWEEILTPEILDIINPILDPYIKKWETLK